MAKNPLVPREAKLSHAIVEARQMKLYTKRLRPGVPEGMQMSLIGLKKTNRKQRPITLAGQKATDDKG